MREIKTIKGKCDFLYVSLTDKTKSFASDLKSNSDLTEKWFILSTITEEQASLLVDYDNDDNYKDYTVARSCFQLKTAKESLFSLLKVNDCLTKQMALDGSYYHAYIFDEVGQTKQQDVILRWEENNEGLERKVFAKPIEELPDDYLLIIKQ